MGFIFTEKFLLHLESIGRKGIIHVLMCVCVCVCVCVCDVRVIYFYTTHKLFKLIADMLK